jgi:hypothetical protein
MFYSVSEEGMASGLWVEDRNGQTTSKTRQEAKSVYVVTVAYSVFSSALNMKRQYGYSETSVNIYQNARCRI